MSDGHLPMAVAALARALDAAEAVREWALQAVSELEPVTPMLLHSGEKCDEVNQAITEAIGGGSAAEAMTVEVAAMREGLQRMALEIATTTEGLQSYVSQFGALKERIEAMMAALSNPGS